MDLEDVGLPARQEVRELHADHSMAIALVMPFNTSQQVVII